MYNANKIKIAVLGAGGWGITLANHCIKSGQRVSLWEFDSQAAQKLNRERKRDKVLPGIPVHPDIDITDDIEKAVSGATMILLVVPSHVARSVIKQLHSLPNLEKSVLVNCAKGIENDSLCRISQIVEQKLPPIVASRYAVLSGPSHAEEVSRGIPTAVVVASKDDPLARFVQETLTSHFFRVYRSHDVVGVELGGSLKNVIAIAAGICDGAGFGDNTKAALQPRGLAEITRLGQEMKANPMTFAGLSGIGDLIVTCMSKHSRNRYLGEQIGKGKTLDEVLENMVMVAEGVRTCKSVIALAKKYNVEMPISQEVYNVLFEQKDAKSALEDLFNREVKPEIWY